MTTMTIIPEQDCVVLIRHINSARIMAVDAEFEKRLLASIDAHKKRLDEIEQRARLRRHRLTLSSHQAV